MNKIGFQKKKTSSEVFLNAFAPMGKGLASPIVKQLNNLLYPRGYTTLPIQLFSSEKDTIKPRAIENLTKEIFYDPFVYEK